MFVFLGQLEKKQSAEKKSVRTTSARDLFEKSKVTSFRIETVSKSIWARVSSRRGGSNVPEPELGEFRAAWPE